MLSWQPLTHATPRLHAVVLGDPSQYTPLALRKARALAHAQPLRLMSRAAAFAPQPRTVLAARGARSRPTVCCSERCPSERRPGRTQSGRRTPPAERTQKRVTKTSRMGMWARYVCGYGTGKCLNTIDFWCPAIEFCGTVLMARPAILSVGSCSTA